MAPELERLGRSIDDVRWILLTHGHIDHLGGAQALWELTGRKAQVTLHEGDADLLRSREAHVGKYVAIRERYLNDPDGAQKERAAAQGAISGEMEPTLLLAGGEQLDLGAGVVCDVVPLPGHTPGSVAYAINGNQAVFVGDAVQIHGAANGFPGYEDPDAYRASLLRLQELDPERLYLGHPYRRSDGTPYGVELNRRQAREAIQQSLDLEERIRESATKHLADALVASDSPYSPFEAVATNLGYTGDPTLDPSPFFTTLDGYRRLLGA